MSESDRALEIVQLAVQAMKDRGASARAHTAALAALTATAANGAPANIRAATSLPIAEPTTVVAERAPKKDLVTTSSAAPATEAAAQPRAASAASRKPSAPAVNPVPSKLAPATGTKAERLAAMREKVLPCTLCPNLVASRIQVVFGVGSPEAELMFVGEAPGADEDLAGEPFVGKAGQLLTKVIETMGLSRDQVYIANVLKCRPDMPAGSSGNRKPTLPEMNTCKPYLLEQIEIIQPRVIVGLGATAMEGLLGVDKFFITKERGHWKEFAGIPLMPTFHPAYVLRNQALSVKRQVWEDMLQVLEKLGKPISEKQRAYFLSK